MIAPRDEMPTFRADQIDLLKLKDFLWPDVVLYDKQKEIILSAERNDETYVPAGNMLGKDFVTGLLSLLLFIKYTPSRIVTTSVDQGQLENVLWGEIANFLATCRFNLPLRVNHLHIRKVINGKEVPKAYLIGRVAAKEEGLLGHHLPRGPFGEPRTWMIYDECSGIRHEYKEKTDTWAHRTLGIGNPFECENFFKQLVKGGDIPDPDNPGRYHVKIINIRGSDSPNVQFAMAQQTGGGKPTGEILVPGLIDWPRYQYRLKHWPISLRTVSLDGEFYEGREVKLFPADWLSHAEDINASRSLGKMNRRAEAIGVDTAQGGDNTCWCVVDRYGLIEMISKKTPNTATIVGDTIALIKKYNCVPENVLFDAGGGGQQHADRLREMKYNVRSIPFGGSATPPPKRGMISLEKKIVESEIHYAYKNKRAEMYGTLSNILDAETNKDFGLPQRIINATREDGQASLRRQLAVIPKQFDGEGRMWLPPKYKKNRDDKTVTLTELIGCSPDESDALALAVYGMVNKRKPNRISVS